MNHEVDDKLQGEVWPILQSIAATQAHKPAPLSEAEKEARWQCAGLVEDLPASSSKLASALAQPADLNTRLALQLQQLSAGARPVTANAGLVQIQAQAQANPAHPQQHSIQALFKRLANGDKDSSPSPGKTDFLGRVFNK